MKSVHYTNLFLGVIATCLTLLLIGNSSLFSAQAQEPSENPITEEPIEDIFVPWKCVQVKDFGDQPGYQRLQELLNTSKATQVQMVLLEAKDEYSKNKITACYH